MKLVVVISCLVLAQCSAAQTIIGNPTATQTITQPGSTNLNVNRLEAVEYADQFSGADIGAKVNAAVTACAGTACPIYVPAGTYTYATPIVLASNVNLYGAGEGLTTLTFSPTIVGQAHLTACAVASGVLTLTGVNGYTAGTSVMISGFTGACSFLDGFTGAVLSYGLSTSQFELNTSASNLATTSDTGISISPGAVAISASSSTTNIYLHDLTVQGPTETPSSAASYNNFYAVALNGTYSIIERIKALHFWGYGTSVYLGGSHETVRDSDIEYFAFGVGGGSFNTFENNFVSNHMSQAIAYESPSIHYWGGIFGEPLVNDTIINNYVYDTGDSAIYTGGSGSNSYGNKIIGNTVQYSWNRGIDQGVSGDVTGSQSIQFETIMGNHLIDNRADNIWIVCDQNDTVTGNTSQYDSNYATWFGSHGTISSASDITIYEGCGAGTAADKVTGTTITGNTISDSIGFASLNLNLSGGGTGNYVAGNTLAPGTVAPYVISGFTAGNYLQYGQGVQAVFASPFSWSGASFYNQLTTTNNYGGNLYSNSSQNWVAGFWGNTNYSIENQTSGTMPFFITPAGVVTVQELGTTQSPTASTTAANYEIPVVIRGTTYYMKLSSTP